MRAPPFRSLTVVLAAAAALVATAPAGAIPVFSCTVEPFAYDVVSSEYDGHTGRYAYEARGTTMLTGPACPVDGRVIRIRELGHLQAAFDFFHIASGSYEAQADVDHDGKFDDARVEGRVTLFGPGLFGVFPQVVVVEKGDVRMTLEQLAFIDFTNPHDPLIFLETTAGEVGVPVDDGTPLIPLP